MQAGLVIADRYELEHELGEGAMGAVWGAKHRSLGTSVAVKIIRREAALNNDARQRFEREALLAARIRSAHVVQVLDHGHHDGLPYIVMEYLVGESLRQRLETRGRLSLPETALIVRHVCRALAQAHDVGLVHRDIKPENLFVSPGEEEGEELVKVLDFGVAKVTDELGHSGVAPTRTGALLGTPFYVSPEQAKGLKLVGPPADMWSLGVVAFECLTGKRPFDAKAMGPLMAKIIDGPIPVPSQQAPDARIPPNVDHWVATALCRDPEGRFASARAMSKSFLAAAQMPDPSLVGRSSSDRSVEVAATLLLDSSNDALGSGPGDASDLAKTAVLPETVALPSLPLPGPLPVPAAPASDASQQPVPGVAAATSAADKMPSNESLIARPWPDPVEIPRTSRSGLFIGLAIALLAALAGGAMWLLSDDATAPSTAASAAPGEASSPQPAESDEPAPQTSVVPSNSTAEPAPSESAPEPSATPVKPPTPPAWPTSKPPTAPPTAPPPKDTAEPWKHRKTL